MNVNYNIAGLANNINHSLTAREAKGKCILSACTGLHLHLGWPRGTSDPKWTMTMDLARSIGLCRIRHGIAPAAT